MKHADLSNPMDAELFISHQGRGRWAVLREGSRVVEFRTEETDAPTQVGWIIKGRVEKVLPGLQSAFVDVGAERSAFLHADELLLPGDVLTAAEPGDSSPRPPIQDRLKPGTELAIQIEREALGEKGARATCFMSLASRCLVMFPHLKARKVSRRIVDEAERERLQAIVGGLPGDSGFIMRTAAEGLDEAQLTHDATQLADLWHTIQQRIANSSAPAVVYQQPGFVIRLIQDAAGSKLKRIVFDDAQDLAQAEAHLEVCPPVERPRLELHDEAASLSETYRLERELDRALRRKVWLKSGGYLVIEPTEALVSIDVNTGKFVGRGDAEETVLKTNLEAADEIAHQLRLRDLGGIIVVDMIDMESAEAKQQFHVRLAEALRHDPARTRVHGITELGLVQLTRKRTRPSSWDTLTEFCPNCQGKGRVRRWM